MLIHTDEKTIITKERFVRSANNGIKTIPNGTQPFLTIVTRAYKKPRCLERNIKSIISQTDLDLEQIIIEDKIGQGLAWADQILNEYKHLNTGKYVLVLDDDDEILNKSFVEILKDINNRYDPDIIVWRGYFSEVKYSLPPLDHRWGNIIERGLVGSFNYCVKTELYNKYIYRCTSGKSGDFDFMDGLLSEVKPENIYWIKKILVGTQQKSYGLAMDKSE